MAGERVKAPSAGMLCGGLLRGPTRAGERQEGKECERDDVITAVKAHLGFTAVTASVRCRMKTILNSGIRQGLLGCQGRLVWREE